LGGIGLPDHLHRACVDVLQNYLGRQKALIG
jgi:hypothetical protein